MRAIVLTGHGGLEVIQVANLPTPEPKPDEVRVHIQATALNRLDLWVRLGWKGLHLDFPHIICSDGAGVVDAVGDGVTQFQRGDRVCIDPTIVQPDDPALWTGLENQSRIHVLGESVPGTAADYIVVPQRNLLKMPDHVTYLEAASAGLVYLTAWHSLVTRGQIRAGQTVLIVGAGGGVNSASIQIAKLAGAIVYVVGSSAEKCAKAVELGADFTIDRQTDPNWSRVIYEQTQKRGVDIVVDNVGQDTIQQSLRAVRIGGQILIVGNTSGPFAEIDLRYIFTKHISLIGSTMGPHQDYVRVMNLIFEGQLQTVISAVLPMTEAQQAQEMLANYDVFGKIMFDMTL